MQGLLYGESVISGKVSGVSIYVHRIILQRQPRAFYQIVSFIVVASSR